MPPTEFVVTLGDGGAARIAIDDAGIVAQVERESGPPSSAAGGSIASLGLVDLQVNGFAGIDFNDPGLDAAGLDLALEAMARGAVTRCLPTLISAPVERLEACFAALEKACNGSRFAPSMVPGYHLEGPFLSPVEGYCGAHPAAAMRPGDIGVFERLNRAAGGRIRLLTIAPEVAGALPLIAHACGKGIAVAIGHSAATREQIGAAAEAGAVMCTHLGNGTPQVMSRNDNVVLSQLAEDRLLASFIADGLHIPPATLGVYLRAKGLERAMLVTDATAVAGAPAGSYTVGPVPIRRGDDGSARMVEGGRLAGSGLTLADAVANVMQWLGLGFAQAIGMARDLPLKVLGRTALPKPGDRAEIVQWRNEAGRYGVVSCRLGNTVISG